MRYLLTALLAMSLTLSGRAADTKPNNLTSKEITDGWILLFDGETTFGWTIDGEAKVQNGVLVIGGSRAATASIATRFGMDFQLQFDFLNCAAVCKVKGGVYQGQARNIENDLRLAEGVPASQWHRCTIQASYRKGYFDTKADINPVRGVGQRGGRTEGFSSDPFPCAFGFEVAKGSKLSIRNIKLRPMNMKSLFNGKDLTGWKEFPDRKSKFTISQDGDLSIKNGPGDLQTTGQWADFLLQLECKTNGDNLNSGVFFRCQPDKYQQGYEAQIQNQHAKASKPYTVDVYDPQTHKLKEKQKVENWSQDYGTGAIYRRIPARRAVAKDREWFTMTVVAHGRHIATWVNGIQVVDWTDNRPNSDNGRNGFRSEKGPISLQGHDPTTDLSFRNIRIADLGETKKN